MKNLLSLSRHLIKSQVRLLRKNLWETSCTITFSYSQMYLIKYNINSLRTNLWDSISSDSCFRYLVQMFSKEFQVSLLRKNLLEIYCTDNCLFQILRMMYLIKCQVCLIRRNLWETTFTENSFKFSDADVFNKMPSVSIEKEFVGQV